MTTAQDATKYFERDSIEQLYKRKAHYEKIIEREELQLKGWGVPWMLPAWRRGLEAINLVITEKEQNQ